MTHRKQINSKLRCNVIFRLFLFLCSGAISLLPTSHAHDEELIQTLSNRNLHFAFNIYQLMADQEDFVLSPFCISVGLTMTSFGARNNTLKQLNEALQLNGFDDHLKIAKAYNSVLKSLDLKGDVTLTISNRILIDKSYHIKKPFQDVIEKEFRSVAQSVNFLDDGQTLNKEINKNLKQLAQDKFKNLPFLENEEKSLGAVLLSAIYFKGKWAQQFRGENTKDERFLMANKTPRMVPMMNTVGMFYCAEDENLRSKILQLECSGNRLLIYFILPDEDEGLEALNGKLNPEWFKDVRKSMRLKTVMVKLPKFNSTYTKELSPELKNLHIFDSENEGEVDLSDIAEPEATGSPLFVQKVLFAAEVEMGEEGAAAVALPQSGGASGVGASGSNRGGASANHELPEEFFADHPFVFIIYDTITNFILFIGNVNNPSVS